MLGAPRFDNKPDKHGLKIIAAEFPASSATWFTFWIAAIQPDTVHAAIVRRLSAD